MDIECSYGAFTGAVSDFQRFRVRIAMAFEKTYDIDYFKPEGNPGLTAFLSLRDLDSGIDAETCAQIALEMEALLPKLDEMEIGLEPESVGETARRFIAGCRAAAKAGEPMQF